MDEKKRKRQSVLDAIAEYLRTHEEVEVFNWKTGQTLTFYVQSKKEERK